MKTIFYIIIGALIGLVGAGIIWFVAMPPRGEAVLLIPTPSAGMLTIYISGAVAKPGVYSLPSDSRVNAAIIAAGGFVPGADQELINLAAPLKDGEQIDVPGIVDSGHINAGRVNINTATLAELDALPGIGLTTAQAIVDYRIQIGTFQYIQDLLNVPGIGPSTFDKIKNFITVEP